MPEISKRDLVKIVALPMEDDGLTDDLIGIAGEVVDIHPDGYASYTGVVYEVQENSRNLWFASKVEKI